MAQNICNLAVEIHASEIHFEDLCTGNKKAGLRHSILPLPLPYRPPPFLSLPLPYSLPHSPPLSTCPSPPSSIPLPSLPLSLDSS